MPNHYKTGLQDFYAPYWWHSIYHFDHSLVNKVSITIWNKMDSLFWSCYNWSKEKYQNLHSWYCKNGGLNKFIVMLWNDHESNCDTTSILIVSWQILLKITNTIFYRWTHLTEELGLRKTSRRKNQRDGKQKKDEICVSKLSRENSTSSILICKEYHNINTIKFSIL